MNGVDVSNAPHEEALQIFLNAQEPIIVEVKRRIIDLQQNQHNYYPLTFPTIQTTSSGTTLTSTTPQIAASTSIAVLPPGSPSSSLPSLQPQTTMTMVTTTTNTSTSSTTSSLSSVGGGCLNQNQNQTKFTNVSVQTDCCMFDYGGNSGGGGNCGGGGGSGGSYGGHSSDYIYDLSIKNEHNKTEQDEQNLLDEYFAIAQVRIMLI